MDEVCIISKGNTYYYLDHTREEEIPTQCFVRGQDLSGVKFTIRCFYRNADSFDSWPEDNVWGLFPSYKEAEAYIKAQHDNHLQDIENKIRETPLVGDSKYPWSGYFTSDHTFTVQRVEQYDERIKYE